MTSWLTCRADRLARLRRERAARKAARALAQRQADRLNALGARALIAPRSTLFYRQH